jgi:hypothetical protein
LESQEEEQEDLVEDDSRRISSEHILKPSFKFQKESINLVSNIRDIPPSKVCATTSMKNPDTTLKSMTSPIMEGTPFRVSITPHPIGELVGDVLEGEENYNSPSFADVLKMDSHHSPPLTRGRKSHKKRREKEAESSILSGSQKSLRDFSASLGALSTL